MSDEKPQYLYHGTCYLIGDAIEPQLCPGDINGDFKDGKRKLTFAADDTRQSKIFSFNIASPDSANIKFLMESGYTGSESGITWSAAFINRKGLEEAVKHFTPTVYTVDSAPFTQNMRDGRPTGEWVSPETVKPVSKQAVTMEDILQDGTQIFFVGHPHITKDVWNRTRQKHLKDWKFEPGDGPLAYYAALKREGLIEHENERLGIKPVDLEACYKPGRYDEVVKTLKLEMGYERLRQIICDYAHTDPTLSAASVAARKAKAKV